MRSEDANYLRNPFLCIHFTPILHFSKFSISATPSTQVLQLTKLSQTEVKNEFSYFENLWLDTHILSYGILISPLPGIAVDKTENQSITKLNSATFNKHLIFFPYRNWKRYTMKVLPQIIETQKHNFIASDIKERRDELLWEWKSSDM